MEAPFKNKGFFLFQYPLRINTSKNYCEFNSILFYFKDFIYLFVRERESESEHRQTEWKAEAEGEAGSLWSKEPDVGLDPRTLGS